MVFGWIKKHKLVMFFLVVIMYLIYNTTTEGMTNTCEDRTSCSNCLNGGYDSTGSVCYWCSNYGCTNPDNFYDGKTCSSDKSKCSVTTSTAKPIQFKPPSPSMNAIQKKIN